MSNFSTTQNNSTNASGERAAPGTEGGDGSAPLAAGNSGYQARQTPNGTLFVETKVALGGLSLPPRPKTGSS